MQQCAKGLAFEIYAQIEDNRFLDAFQECKPLTFPINKNRMHQIINGIFSQKDGKKQNFISNLAPALLFETSK